MSVWHCVAGALRGVQVVELYADGSGEERVGKRGGWAYLVVRDDQVIASKSGGAKITTSLVMELEAARQGLEEIVSRGWHRGQIVELISDSSIALDVAAGRFLPKRHTELAKTLRAICLEVGARTRWVRAHSGHRWNEAVDAAAHAAKMKR